MAKSDPNSAEALNTKIRGGIASGFNAGPTSPTYPGLGQPMQNALSDVSSAGMANKGLLNQAFGSNWQMLTNGGLTGDQRANMGLVNNLAQTSGAGNPYVDQIIKQTNDNTYADVMASLGGMGAIGSNLHMKELGGALADNESRIRYDDYNQGFNRQLGAAQAGFGMGQTGQANMFGAIDRAPTSWQSTLLPYQNALQEQSALDADSRAAKQYDPTYEHLLKYQGLLSGNAANPQPAKQPGFMDYAMLGGGLLSAFL